MKPNEPRGIHRPAAHAWVRTPIDARRYIDENLNKIAVLVGRNSGEKKSYFLSELPPPLRMMFVVRFLDKFREDGSLPGTIDDAMAAMKAAEELAKNGETPILGKMRSDGTIATIGILKDGQWEHGEDTPEFLGKKHDA